MSIKTFEIINNNRQAFNNYFLDGCRMWHYETHDACVAIYRYGTRTKIIQYNDIEIWHNNKNLIEFVNGKG